MELIKKDKNSIPVAAVSAFVSNQLKQRDPYPFCPNPLDLLFITNLVSFQPNLDKLFDQVIGEAEFHRLTWENRTTKNGYQSDYKIFETSSPNIKRLKELILKVIESYKLEFANSNYIIGINANENHK